MAGSARFGGQVDASGILADIYESDLRNREALANAAAGRAREEQNALDRDAQSRWQSGEMSDADWLAYAAARIRANAQFPEEKAEWEKVYRESSDMIAVNQAESAYMEGGSINQLIAFYQQRVNRSGGNSAGGRESRERLNQLMDQRLSDEVSQRVDQIQDQIDAGTAKPDALLAYLRGARGQARNGSDLARSIDKDIEQVGDQIAQFSREYSIQNLQHRWQTGQITGDQYATEMRALAQTYANTDASTYFQMLDEASVGDRYGSYGFDGSTGGSSSGGGGVGGRRSGGSGVPTIGGLMDEWEDRRWRAQDILTQVMNGATEVTDPGTGEKVDVTTASGKRFLENVNRDVFSTYTAQRRVGHETGNRDMIESASEGHDKFLVEFTQPSNTMLERESAGVLINSIQRSLADIEAHETDPAAAVRRFDALAGRVDRYLQQRSTTQTFNAPAGVTAVLGSKTTKQYEQASRVPAGEGASLDPGFIGEMTALSAALKTGQFDEGMLTDRGVGDILKADALTAIAEASAITREKDAGMGSNWTYAILPNEGISVVPMVPGTRQVVDPTTGAAQVVKVPVVPEEVLRGGGVTEGHVPVAVAVQVGDGVIRMNGYASQQATPWQVWATAEDFKSDNLGRTIKKGTYVTSEMISSLGDEWAEMRDTGAARRAFYTVMTFQAPDAQGRTQTWTQLPGGSWVKGTFPMRPRSLEDGTVALDADGSISGAMVPIQSVPVPFLGRDPKLAQAAIDRGDFADVVAGIRGVNWETGDAMPDPFDPTGVFWSEEDEAKRTKALANFRAMTNESTDWWDTKGRAQRGADNWHANKRALREANKQRSEADMASNYRANNPLSDLFENEGGALGLSFGKQRPGGDQQKPAERTPTSWPIAQMPDVPQGVRLPRIGPTAPRMADPLPPRLPAPQASSGPHLVRTTDRATPKPQPSTGSGSFLSPFFASMSRLRALGTRSQPESTVRRTPGGPTPY